MRRQERTAFALACGLAAVAGCTDSIAFLLLRGFFASFMSGNSTRLAIGLAAADRHDAMEAAGLIGLFVAGVIGGRLIGRPNRVLGSVTALLLASALLGTLCGGAAARTLPVAVAVLALGGANNVVGQAGRISLSATYITGTLVKMGQGIGAALAGEGDRGGWLPYATLWLSLLCGAVLGALLFPYAGPRALWLPAAGCAALLLWHRRRTADGP